jgi:CRISPR-associated endoribonuclease Cas6
MHLDGRSFAAGKRFHFDLNLFDTETPAVAYLVLAFAQLAREGLGPHRGKVELTSVMQLSVQGEPSATVYENGSMMVQQNIPPLELNLAQTEEAVGRLLVRFVTPTELKSGHQIAPTPEFGILLARVRDRISTLRELYGGGALDIDFRAFGERAAAVRMTRCAIRDVDVMRRSSRTGQVHPIGGFVGEVEYEGELAEFVPYLKVAKWTGVGRQTVWGKGEIAVERS